MLESHVDTRYSGSNINNGVGVCDSWQVAGMSKDLVPVSNGGSPVYFDRRGRQTSPNLVLGKSYRLPCFLLESLGGALTTRGASLPSQVPFSQMHIGPAAGSMACTVYEPCQPRGSRRNHPNKPLAVAQVRSQPSGDEKEGRMGPRLRPKGKECRTFTMTRNLSPMPISCHKT